ncbi:flavin reductase family protein [Amycolatopsis viridis]|nr:flavin reductase family protein [Amycolatopsis viridis]
MIPLDHLDPAELFAMVSWTIAPRPIAWVTSVSPAGDHNLAPFSFFTIASTDPLILMIAIEPREDGSVKDTLGNVLSTRQFVVHIAELDRLPEVARSGDPSPPDFDELADLALPTSAATVVRPPVIDGCAAVFECELLTTHRPGLETLVFGRVVAARVAEHLITGCGRVDVAALRPLGRIGNVFTASTLLERPDRPVGTAC